jgi:primosomal protein N' (replication factor Y) (superfamily II helicase)
MKKATVFIEVAVDAPVKNTLTYILPARLEKNCEKGKRVVAPLGRRKVTGYVISFPKECEINVDSLKEVEAVIDDVPLFTDDLLRLFQWASGYYFAPLAEVIKTALPAGTNVKSIRSIQITKKGRSEVSSLDEKSGRKTMAREFLSFMNEKGRINYDKIESVFGKKVSGPVISKFIKDGFLDQSYIMSSPKVKEKSERGIELLKNPAQKEIEKLEKRAPQQAKLLKELVTIKRTSLKDLKGGYKSPGRIGKELEKAKYVKFIEIKKERDLFSRPIKISPPPDKLMENQTKSIKSIVKGIESNVFHAYLLYGVTGSGKTEVYIRSIDHARNQGKSAILLVPEIALTPQLIARFKQRFDNEDVAVLHSALSSGERYDQWWRIKRGKAKIVIGARSAVFAPVSDLGLIVVDEEQESAYKQDHGFMYNGRDLAVMRAKMEKAAVVLGTATPSMESAFNASKKEAYNLLVLPERVDNRPMPDITVVDMNSQISLEDESPSPKSVKIKDQDRIGAAKMISAPLREAITRTIADNQQVILFLNRRGVSSVTVCVDCGHRMTCPACDVGLVHHKTCTPKADRYFGEPCKDGYLLCHYCGYHISTPDVCPNCRGIRVYNFGAGTEQVESALIGLFPEAAIMRMDSDVMTGKKSWFEKIEKISRGEVDIIIGTQMVAKGHDLPGVTLVGVLLADQGLNIPDFRAAEKTFQMITQVSGRAGRGKVPGRVFVQTFNAEHFAVQNALKNDFKTFYGLEAGLRRSFWYPPFARTANLRIVGINEKHVKESSKKLGAMAKRKSNLKSFQSKVKILGPAPAPISRIRGKSRFMLFVKADQPSTMSSFLTVLMNSYNGTKTPAGVNIEIDRDPLSML